MDILNVVGNIFLEQSEFWWLAFLFIFGWVWTVWADDADTAAAANINRLQDCKVDTNEVPLLDNILLNSQFGVWSQSDVNKGFGYLVFDAGAVIAPVIGEAITSTCGATGKVIWINITNNDWAGGNGAGTIYLGACSTLCFNNNEAITWPGGGNALVNQPDGAVGTDGFVRNGAFVDVVNPPNDWTAGGGGVLTTVGGGQVGNCMTVTDGGAGNGYGWQRCTGLTAGKIYKISVWHENGTGTSGWILLGSSGLLGGEIASLPGLNDATWTQHVVIFEATTTDIWIVCRSSQVGNSQKFDEITLCEITPCCTANNTATFDGWYKTGHTDLYRQHRDATYTKDGSFYSLKIVPTQAALDGYVRFPGGFYDQEEWYMQFRGRAVAFGAWVYTDKPNHARLRIIDSVGNTQSAYHTGVAGWEWLEVTRVVDAAAISLQARITADAAASISGASIIYISQPMFIFCNATDGIIGEGNYVPKPQEWIYCEKFIPSNKYDNTTGWGTVAWAFLNLETDSDAIIPKGAKAIKVHLKALDSGSGALVDVHFHLRKDATAGEDFAACWGGRTNSVEVHMSGHQPCNIDGDVEVDLAASGGATLDIVHLRYMGVQVT